MTPVSNRPALFYKDYCRPCQWMSRLVVVFSFGTIRRVPLTSDEARNLYRRFPEQEGQLVLIDGDRVTFGRMVFAAVPRTVVTAWLRVVFPDRTPARVPEEITEVGK